MHPGVTLTDLSFFLFDAQSASACLSWTLGGTLCCEELSHLDISGIVHLMKLSYYFSWVFDDW